ncbi:MAG: hypothetical protein ACYTF3_00190 [Planctomycetota bacterium]
MPAPNPHDRMRIEALFHAVDRAESACEAIRHAGLDTAPPRVLVTDAHESKRGGSMNRALRAGGKAARVGAALGALAGLGFGCAVWLSPDVARWVMGSRLLPVNALVGVAALTVAGAAALGGLASFATLLLVFGFSRRHGDIDTRATDTGGTLVVVDVERSQANDVRRVLRRFDPEALEATMVPPPEP